MGLKHRLWKQIVICVLLVCRVSAQSPSNILGVAEGLPSTMVIAMVQDKAGFIWIATIDGLVRYDGQRSKIFRNMPNTVNSLIDNQIIQMQLVNNKLLLVTQSGNIQLFNPVTEQFTLLFSDSYLKNKGASMEKCYLSADEKHLWGFMLGVRLVHYDFEKKQLRVFSEKELTGENNSLHDFYYSDKGFVYIFYKHGIIQINTRNYRQKKVLYDFDKKEESIRNIGNTCAERANGEIITILKKGALVYEPTHGQLHFIPFPARGHVSTAYTIRKLQDGNIYIGTESHLYRLNNQDDIETIDKNSQRLLMPYLLDHSGNLWVNHPVGLEKRQLKPSVFQTFAYQKSFKEDLINQFLKIPFHSFQPHVSSPFFQPKQNKGWFIEIDTVYKYDFDKHQLEKTLFHHCCNLSLKISAQPRLITYTNYFGLYEIDTSLGNYKVYPNSLLPALASERGLDVSDIQPTRNGVWVASRTGQGLFFYDLRKQSYTHILQHSPKDTTTLTNNNLQCLSADYFNQDILWIGTGGGGLCRLDTRMLQIKRILEKDGLPNATIQAMQTDKNGFLWCSTNKGLARVDTRTYTIRRFYKSDGLQDEEFGTNFSAMLPDGRFAFGGKSGMTVFNPLAVRDAKAEESVVLCSLKINNEETEPGQADSPLLSSINSLQTLELNYAQNFLTFGFSALEYAKPEQIHYRYRLIGVDKNWVNAGTRTEANYTQIPPGTYVFEVLATNADGIWGTNKKQLTIIIHPPLWATWWAYSLYFLITGIVIYGFARNRLDRMRQKQEIELKRQEAEQLRILDEVKSRFFSNITHEFRTPLSLIISPTEQLLNEPKHDEFTRRSLSAVRRNARLLLRLINQLLDLAKLEGGNMLVVKSIGNPIDFVREVANSFQSVATQKGISLHLEEKDPEGEYLFDADKLEKIVTNLISNAIKFTEKGEIKINAEINTQTNPVTLFILIADSGIGIPKEKLPYIFNRFYQVDDTRTRQYEGTGIGLSLVKELTELMSGHISVTSESGKGTTFQLQLPIKSVELSSVAPLAKITTTPGDLEEAHIATLLKNKLESNSDAALILVVEDNEELREFIAGELSAFFNVRTAKNGEEGLAIALEILPDIVISDIMMPLMDGYELTRQLKTNPATDHIAVVLLTAKTAHQSLQEGLLQGADEYMTKPFHFDELQLRIRNILSRQEKLRKYYTKVLASTEDKFDPEVIEDAFLKKLFSILETHLDDSQLTVEVLAGKLAMSRRTLNRKLNLLINQSPNDLIRHYRLKRAVEYLRQGNNVSETAFLVGFESPAYFSTVFKEFYQKAPSEFMAR